MNSVIKSAMKHWPEVAPLLVRPRTRADYRKLVEALDTVLDAGGADEKHPLAGLADYLGELIHAYEAVHTPLPAMPVHDLLRALMKQHGLTQSSVPEIGPQSVVSAVLNGRRTLNLRQVARLSRRFNLPADVFID